MGRCVVLEYVTAIPSKSIAPVVSLPDVRLASRWRACGTLPCGRADTTRTDQSHDRPGFWRIAVQVMRLTADPALAPYAPSCALLEGLSGKLKPDQNSRSYRHRSIHVGISTPVRSIGPEAETSMTVQFFKRILQKCCRHRFSWPHTGMHGQDYQVCLLCGAAYEFDCATMTRTGRLVEPVDLRAPGLSAGAPRISRTD